MLQTTCYMHLCCLLSHDLLCDCSLNANMFLCHLFLTCLILPKSLSFHTWVHFSSLLLNVFISDVSCGFMSSRQLSRASLSQILSIAISHPSFCIPPVTPSTQSYASLHSWRVAGITVCLSWERSVKENVEHLMFSPGWSHSDFVISVYLLLFIWPIASLWH